MNSLKHVNTVCSSHTSPSFEKNLFIFFNLKCTWNECKLINRCPEMQTCCKVPVKHASIKGNNADFPAYGSESRISK